MDVIFYWCQILLVSISYWCRNHIGVKILLVSKYHWYQNLGVKSYGCQMWLVSNVIGVNIWLVSKSYLCQNLTGVKIILMSKYYLRQNLGVKSYGCQMLLVSISYWRQNHVDVKILLVSKSYWCRNLICVKILVSNSYGCQIVLVSNLIGVIVSNVGAFRSHWGKTLPVSNVPRVRSFPRQILTATMVSNMTRVKSNGCQTLRR